MLDPKDIHREAVELGPNVSIRLTHTPTGTTVSGQAPSDEKQMLIEDLLEQLESKIINYPNA